MIAQTVTQCSFCNFTEARLEGKKYSYILDKPYRWESWASPKDKNGQVDHNKAETGDDLRDFVNGKLFPYLHGFKGSVNYMGLFSLIEIKNQPTYHGKAEPEKEFLRFCSGTEVDASPYGPFKRKIVDTFGTIADMQKLYKAVSEAMTNSFQHAYPFQQPQSPPVQWQ